MCDSVIFCNLHILIKGKVLSRIPRLQNLQSPYFNNGILNVLNSYYAYFTKLYIHMLFEN